ncbi:glutathionylspermidine synthase family protein [bacterium]|nr:MAG: glutathionylspermidine synthase family protein [bacterium]
MQRIFSAPDWPDWEEKLRQGLPYFQTELPSGKMVSYFDVGGHYQFTSEEVTMLEQTVADLIEMYIEAGDHVLESGLWERFGIPPWAQKAVEHSWLDFDGTSPSVYSRFDIRYGGACAAAERDPTLLVPKLYEFNAQTPTSLPESALTQWQWFEELKTRLEAKDQWNGLHEALIAAWQRNLAMVEARLGYKPIVWFAPSNWDDSGEDLLNVAYLMDTCRQAGYEVQLIWMEDIVRSDQDGRFYAPTGQHLDVVFALYPWEMTFADNFGKPLVDDIVRGVGPNGGTAWIEPYYKLLWSNKAMLPVLWKLFGTDSRYGKYLLPSYFQDEMPLGFNDDNYVIKPIFSREGASLTVIRNGEVVVSMPGRYGKEGSIVQALAAPPAYLNPLTEEFHYPVLGLWAIDCEPYGCGIRESRGDANAIVTNNLSYFVPQTIGFSA